MVLLPRLEGYDINALVALGNQIDDDFHRDTIKKMIIDKVLMNNYPIFIFINKFNSSIGIIKEVYAEVIVILMKDNDYYIDDKLVDEILRYTSLDTLVNYGMKSSSSYFRERCIDEFWKVAIQIENKEELYKKVVFSRRLCKSIKRKLKGDKND